MNHNPIHLVSEEILKEILRKKRLLEGQPDFYVRNEAKRKKALHMEANKHSVSLELELYDTRTSNGRKEKAKEHRICLENLSEALKLGEKNYKGILTDDFIGEIGRVVEPRTNLGGYRTEDVTVRGATYSPTSSEKLGREMNFFLLENACLDNVIEKALHAHFHIARVHPFRDGNGRTARLIQNIMLEYAGFFPIEIKSSERIEYIHLIDEAIKSYRIREAEIDSREAGEYKKFVEECADKKPLDSRYCKELASKFVREKMTPEQNEFYNFIALKMRDALQRQIDLVYALSKRPKDKSTNE